ncbi:MAG: hypothetical protein M3R24_31975 [Chloroflexota bacterium]|nr:hypothetical protein [Chloroflexota bacterium]
MSNIREQLYAEFQAIEARLSAKKPEPYDFRPNEPWNAALEPLPRTCKLWKTFLRYDAARKAYEAQTAKRQAWQQELRRCRFRMTQVDPDTVDMEAWRQDRDRSAVLETALDDTDRQQQYQEFKMVAQQEEETWGRMWQAYVNICAEQRRILRSNSFAGSFVGYDTQAHAAAEFTSKRQQLEAA